nr:AAA family ATPase [Atopomonas sediminilitoris]
MSYDELQQHREQLPQDLQAVLSLAPLPAGSDLFVLHQEARQQLQQALERWQAGAATNIVLFGPDGIGKTSLLNQLEADVEHAVLVRRLCLSKRIRSETELLRYMAQVFDLGECHDLPDLCERLAKVTPQVVLLDNAALLHLRAMGSASVLRVLWRIMLAARQLAWVHVWPEQTWRRVRLQWQLDALVSQDVLLDWPAQAEFLAALEQRFARLKKHGRDLWWQDAEGEAARPFDAQREGLTALYQPCQGNFFSAVYAALCALHKDLDGRVWLRGFRIPEQVDLRSADARTRLTVAEVMAHGSLTAAEHAQIFQLSRDASNWLLSTLRAKQWLISDSQDDGVDVFRINPLFARSLLVALRSSNALY